MRQHEPGNGDFQRLAYHECGHAVAQHSFGWRLQFVAIGRLDENGQHTWSGSAPAEMKVRADGAIIAFSGPLAECRFLGIPVGDDELADGKLPCNSGIDLGGWLRDANIARELCVIEGSAAAIREARTLINSESVWRAVSTLASELCRPDRLVSTPLRGMPENVRRAVLPEFRSSSHDHRIVSYACIWGDEATRIIGDLNTAPTKI